MMIRVRSAGMEAKEDLTSKKTMISSTATECYCGFFEQNLNCF